LIDGLIDASIAAGSTARQIKQHFSQSSATLLKNGLLFEPSPATDFFLAPPKNIEFAHIASI
jgi:hypothetical protein